MKGFFIKATLSLLTPLLFSLSAAASPTSFILASCKPTTYPSLCIQSLSSYAPFVRRSPRQLAHAALTVSASRAREAVTYVSHLSSGSGHNSIQPQVASAFQDCITTMSDSANRLQQSLGQFRHLGRAGRRSFALRLSNVVTWVSAALTDQSMCLLSLSQDEIGSASSTTSRNLHVATKKKVMEVTKVTSNALALVNRLGFKN